MSLFFDSTWFDRCLAELGLSRSDVATALGLSHEQVEELWKDQRELSAGNVRVLAALLGQQPSEIATRAGISTPVPKPVPEGLAALTARLDRIEALLEELRAEVRALNRN